MQSTRILILGAGCAGLGAAYRLHELGHTNFLVVECNSYPGGLAASFIDDKGFTWDIGGHVQFSHYEYFDQLMVRAAPAAALGYGVGRIGCLLAGDGDYGINTTLPWGVHMAKNALVPPVPADALVQPTPIYELLFSLAVFWLLWRLGERARPVGWLTGVYLALSGAGRFAVEFVRINPKLYFHQTMSNAQVAAAASAMVGLAAIAAAQRMQTPWVPKPVAKGQE